jgi:hypothetical protein
MAQIHASMNTFRKETMVDGKLTRVECFELAGQTYCLSRGPVTIARLEDEWYEDVQDPGSVVACLKGARLGVDIFSFWQRVPDTTPHFDFYAERDAVAALPVTTVEHWLNKQVKPTVRNKIRKAHKNGVEMREACYDDSFVRGMTDIFNEVPLRQGRLFWHYGKDFDTVKAQFSRHINREDLLGAYYQDELIGFAMLGNAGRYGVLGQIVSKIQHRDKAPSNALIAKAVEVCERKGLPHLVYAFWDDGSLTDFKTSNGFAMMTLPRYYVPITRQGNLTVAAGLHRGWKQFIPRELQNRLKILRTQWLRVFHS